MSFKIWENVYPSFKLANSFRTGPGFAGDLYRKKSLLSATESISNLKLGAEIPISHKQRNLNLAMVAGTLLSLKKEINILDFGGGLGIGYLTLLESLPNLANKINYEIVDIPQVCEVGNELFKNNKMIHYSSKLKKSKGIDLIYTSSCIQYIESWKNILSEFSIIQPSYILFSDLFVSKKESFVTLQNYYESKIPHWFINFNEFQNELTLKGYELYFKISSDIEILGEKNLTSHTNFPKNLILNRTLNLLYKVSE